MTFHIADSTLTGSFPVLVSNSPGYLRNLQVHPCSRSEYASAPHTAAHTSKLSRCHFCV